MIDTLGSLESGDKYRLEVPGLDYALELPAVILRGDGPPVRIASLNLVGQTRLNRDLGRLLADRIRNVIGERRDVILFPVVEKALELSQVVAEQLGMVAVAVAYNRIKPHMEADRRPTIQVGADSITSGGKYLAVYERDLNFLSSAGGVVLLDDVVSTGGTILALCDLLEEVARFRNLDAPPEIMGIFCVALEGPQAPLLSAPIHHLAVLPEPEPLKE